MMATPQRRPLGERAALSSASDASPSPQPNRTVRFTTQINDIVPSITVPMKCNLAVLKASSLVSSLLARLCAKPSLSAFMDKQPTHLALTLRSGESFCLDMEVNADDTLDCYLDDAATDVNVKLIFEDNASVCIPAVCGVYDEAMGDLLAKPPGSGNVASGIASTAASYASQTKRVLALRSNGRGPTDVAPGMSPPPTGKPSGHRTPGRIATLVDNNDGNDGAATANGGATVNVGTARSRLFRATDDEVVGGSLFAQPPVGHAAPQPTRAQPRPPSRSPEEFVAKPPSRGPSQEGVVPPPRPARMYGGAPAAEPMQVADNATLYRIELILRDCADDEATSRLLVVEAEEDAWAQLRSAVALSAAKATQSAMARVEYAHQAQAHAIEASYDDFFTHEANRFRLLSHCIEEESLLRKANRPGYAAAAADNTAIATLSLKANKASYISSLELVARQEIETIELEARNKLAEDALLFFTRETIRNDERYIMLVRSLKDDEEAKRSDLNESAFRKLAMFHRQCASGVARLAATPV